MLAKIFKLNLELTVLLSSQHSGDSREVICPICTVSSTTDPNHRTDNLANHMAVDHAQEMLKHFRQKMTVCII